MNCLTDSDQMLTTSVITPDLAHTFVLLETLPAVASFSSTLHLRQYALSKARIPDKPLNLKHAVLLL